MMQTNKMLRLTTALVLVVCAWLLGYTWLGYGHVTITAPSDATIQINGHPTSNKSVKLRPGTYHMTIISPRNLTTSDTVHVSLFLTTKYAPNYQQRSASSIAYSTVGVSPNLGVLPPAYNTHWFGDTWVVEETGLSTPLVLAAHYSNGRWQKAYLTGDTGTISALPADVAGVVTSMEGSINAANQ